MANRKRVGCANLYDIMIHYDWVHELAMVIAPFWFESRWILWDTGRGLPVILTKQSFDCGHKRQEGLPRQEAADNAGERRAYYLHSN